MPNWLTYYAVNYEEAVVGLFYEGEPKGIKPLCFDYNFVYYYIIYMSILVTFKPSIFFIRGQAWSNRSL